MINILLLLLFLTCLGITAAWVAENPGSVTMHWFDYRVDTSFAFILLAALVSAFVLANLYILVRRLILAPDYFTHRHTLRKYEKGLAELTYSVASLAAADHQGADAHTRKAEKLLGRTPLILLLSAQVARSQGDEEKTRGLLVQMLEHKETEYLAARYLSDSASKKQLLSKAREMAARAHTINAKGILPLLSLHIRLHEWQHAIIAITKSLRKGQITRTDMRRFKGIVYLQEGSQMLEGGHYDGAMIAAKRVMKELPDSTPAVIFAAHAYNAANKPAKARKLIMHAWKTAPHPQLTEAFRNAIKMESKDKQMKLVHKLAALNPEAVESSIAIAQVAIANKDWATARQILTRTLETAESVRVCELMAEVEQGEYPDFDISSKWLARSAKAMKDSEWVCSSCGTATRQWDAHCPSCHGFDKLEWKQRHLTYAA